MPCTERDARGELCTVEGEHQTITNSRGQQAVAHSTPNSMWSVPKVGIIVPPAPREPWRLPGSPGPG